MNIDKSQDSIAKIAIFFSLYYTQVTITAYWHLVRVLHNFLHRNTHMTKKNVSGFKGYDIRGLLEKFEDKFVRL